MHPPPPWDQSGALKASNAQTLSTAHKAKISGKQWTAEAEGGKHNDPFQVEDFPLERGAGFDVCGLRVFTHLIERVCVCVCLCVCVFVRHKNSFICLFGAEGQDVLHSLWTQLLSESVSLLPWRRLNTFPPI